ncbi:MAG TPA: hypothetical protein EYP85_00285 [Armatimonadetes bacterium]|nr:hypothetical protein [Armatimonadota bacterium]
MARVLYPAAEELFINREKLLRKLHWIAEEAGGLQAQLVPVWTLADWQNSTAAEVLRRVVR